MGLPLGAWRRKRGLSLRQLADRAGVSFVTLYRIEAEKISPTVTMLEKLATALEITVRDFFPAPPRRRTRRRKQ